MPACLTIFIATLIGIIAGYFRGRVDDLLTLLMNLFLVIPGLPLLIFLSAYLAPNNFTVIFVLALTGWAFGARIVRAQTLAVREREFVNAAIVSGEPDSYIIFNEVLPNLTNIVVGSLVGSVSHSIAAATSLAFLGLTSTTDVTWGTNLFWAQNGGALSIGAWWTFVPSGLAVALVIFGLSLINYGMDEITNPRLRAERELSNVVKKGLPPASPRHPGPPAQQLRRSAMRPREQRRAAGRPRAGACSTSATCASNISSPGKGPDGAVQAVDGVSFTIAPGEVFGLAGESGSGKSTIAHSILRVLRPPAVITGGEILFKGRDVLEMGEDEIEQLARAEATYADPPGFRVSSTLRWRRSAGVTWRWSSRAR